MPTPQDEQSEFAKFLNAPPATVPQEKSGFAQFLEEGQPSREGLTGYEKAQQEQLDMFGALDNKWMRRGATYGDNALNAITFGNSTNVNRVFDKLGIGGAGMNAPTPDDARKRTQAFRTELREENPISAIAGDVTGYAAPGIAIYKGIGNAAKATPGVAQAANFLEKSGRLPAYASRMTGAGVAAAADLGIYGATVEAQNRADANGGSASLGDRAKAGLQMAKSDVALNDVPFVNVPIVGDTRIPVAALPVAGSLIERTIKGIQSGGRTVTPDRVAASVLENSGRAPAGSAFAGEVVDVLDGQLITPDTVKSLRFIENALTNAGVSPDRIARGFERLRQTVSSSADGRTPLAMLIEREFADQGPEVARNLRTYLLKQGLDNDAATRGVIDDLRQSQVDDYRGLVEDNLGSQNTLEAERRIAQGLDKIGDGYEQVLGMAREQSNNSPLADSLREMLSQNTDKGLLRAEASKRGWKDVDTFIQEDPWNAGHKLQSRLAKLAENAKRGGTDAYARYREPVEWIQDILDQVPGYKAHKQMYAAEAAVRNDLGYADAFGNETAGFGKRLKKASSSERSTQRIAEQYQSAPERQQRAAQLSAGEVLTDQLRGARPGGTNAAGEDVVGLRLADLQTQGVMDGLRRAFGEKGQRISDGVNDLVDRRQFLADIDPNTGSNTTNKINAQAHGNEVLTRGLPRSSTANASDSMLVDALMLTNGMPPVATLAKNIPGALRLLGPGKKTRQAVTDMLLQLPKRTAPSAGGSAPIKPLSGRNRPKSWRKDKAWNDNVLSNESGFIDPGALTSDIRNLLQMAERRFLPAKSDRHYADVLRKGGVPDEVDPNVPLLEQLQNPRAAAGALADATMRADQRGRLKTLSSKPRMSPSDGDAQVMSYLRKREPEIAAQRGANSSAKDAQNELRRTQYTLKKATERMQSAPGTGSGLPVTSKNRGEFLEASRAYTEAKRNVERARVKAGLAREDIKALPKKDDAAYQALRQELSRRGMPVDGLKRADIPSSNSIDVPRIKPEVDSRMAQLLLDPANANEAARIAREGGSLNTFDNTAKVIGGVGAVGLAGGAHLGIQSGIEMHKAQEAAQREKTKASSIEHVRRYQRNYASDVPHSEMAEIQAMLNYTMVGKPEAMIEMDGIWGPRTSELIMRYQRERGLRATGKLTGETLEFMERDLEGFRAAVSEPPEQATPMPRPQ